MKDLLRLAREVLEAEGEAVLNLSRKLDESFLDAVELLMKTKGRIVLTGIGKSGIICKKIASTLSSTGTPSFYLHPVDAVHGDLGMLKGDDTLIAVSNSGESREVLNVVSVVKSFGIPVIGITNNPNSSLSKLSDIVLLLHVEGEACPLGLAPTTSTTVTLALGDAIAAALMVAKGFESKDFARFHPGGSLGIRLSKVKDLMRRGEEIPVVSPSTPMRDVIFEISSKKLGAALVMDGEKLIGIITDGDLRRFFERGGKLSDPAKEAMTRRPKTISADEFAENALEVMERHKITVLPVVDGGKVEGILHLHDILGRRF